MRGIFDLEASKSCMLTLLKQGAADVTPETLRSVVFAGSVIVRVDDREVHIPQGAERMVASTSMAYELVTRFEPRKIGDAA